ncbi:MAG: M10 family metallopeptidase C-terminal domain-containing protein [Hyphomicrobiales bacterium]
MSYFDQATEGGGTRAYLVTPAMADIYAVQAMYGAVTTSPEDTVQVGSTPTPTRSTTPALTRKHRLSRSTTAMGSTRPTFRLRGRPGHRPEAPGSWSSVGGQVNNVGIYPTTVIENAIGGSGDDVIHGNDASNMLAGLSGKDSIYGGAAAMSSSAVWAGIFSGRA